MVNRHLVGISSVALLDGLLVRIEVLPGQAILAPGAHDKLVEMPALRVDSFRFRAVGLSLVLHVGFGLALVEMLPFLDRHLIGSIGNLLIQLELGFLVGRSLGTAAPIPLPRIDHAPISTVAAISRRWGWWTGRGMAGR